MNIVPLKNGPNLIRMPSLNQNVAFQAKWYVPKQKFMSQTNRYWKKIIPGSKNWDGKSLQIEWVQRWPSYSLETLGNYTQVISILTGDFVKILRLFRPPPFFSTLHRSNCQNIYLIQIFFILNSFKFDQIRLF